MNKIYILVGPPGCGKSTYRETILKETPDAVIVSSDDAIMTLGNGLTYNSAYHSVNEKDVSKIINSTFIEAYKNRKDIIIDMCNMRIKSRGKFISQISDNKYEKIAIVFPYNRKEFIKRNNIRKLEGKYIPLKVWKKFVSDYQEPTYKEGFKKIIYLDGSDKSFWGTLFRKINNRLSTFW